MRNIFLIFSIAFSTSFLAQCPTVAPTAIDGCNISPGSVQIGASGGSTGYYSWYDSNVGGNYLGSGTPFNTPSISSTTTFYVAAADINNALDFDGNNDYVQIGNPSQLQITGDLTIEMWLKPDNFSARRNPYAKAYGGEGTITQETNGTLNYFYGTNGGNGTPYQGFNSGTSLNLGEWNHIAIVRDLTNMQLYWYINGVLTNQTAASYASATAGSLNATIGAGYVSNYDGQIDELRIWNTARSQAQIQNAMNTCLTGSEANLVAYYDFNDGTGTTLTDKTASANNGTLTNMSAASDWVIANYDFYCTSCESSRIAVTATISGGTPVNLGNDTCMTGSKMLDAGASFASYLWSTGANSQTINVSTSGTYWVEANTGTCLDRDTISITFISQPIGKDSCRIGTGTVTLEATGSTGFYNWYASATGGPTLGTGSSFVTPVISSTTTYYVAAADSNFTLDFDGSNDYVQLGNLAQLQIIGDMTIEMWLKPDNFSTRRNPYAKAYGGEGTITQETDGTLNFFYGTNGGNGNPYQVFNSGTSLNLGEWNHIAIVRDLTNMQLYWYINGVLTNQTAASYASATAGSLNATIGAGYVSNYDGQIDELRIWNTARSQGQVQNAMNTCLTGSEANLAAYYDFNDGTGTTLTDKTASANNGTLTNMSAASDWVEAFNNVNCNCESTRVPVVATVSSGTPIDLGNDTSLICPVTNFNLDAGLGFNNYLWSTGANSQTINVTTSGTYWVQVENGSGCYDIDTILIAFPIGSENNLDFDGSNDYVQLGNPAQLQITGDMTIEMWLKPDNFSTRRNPYAKAYGGEGTITQETNGTLNYYYGTNGGNGAPYQGFNSGTSLNLGEWNHITIVRDLTNMQLYWYINGVLTNQTAASYASATAGSLNATIGAGYVSNYDGQIDELRIWNTARSQGQIRSKMCSKVKPSETGLVAYYRFDNGSGTTLTDFTYNSLDGSITNGPIWQVSSAPIGDSSVYLYTGSWAGQTLTHYQCSGENLTVSNMSGAPDGVHIYSVGSVPNDITGIIGLGLNDRYFGVHKVNDKTSTYTATYNYIGNPYVNSFDESTLVLFKRSDNAASPWTNTSATLNTVAKTLVATAQGTEFILGSTGSPLPVELLNFEAIANEGKVDLKWQTASEINNDYFTIEKSKDGTTWNALTDIKGAGNSNKVLNYKITDQNPYQGISYYRIKQTDFDGQFTYSEIKVVNMSESPKDVIIYPNPTKTQITVQGEREEISPLRIFNTLGQDVTNRTQQISKKDNYIVIDLSNLTNGIYSIKTVTSIKKIIKK